VQTDGINLAGAWAHSDLVDVNAITTNDITAMLHTYGVEVRARVRSSTVARVNPFDLKQMHPRMVTFGASLPRGWPTHSPTLP